PEPRTLARAVEVVASAQRPLLVAGGGVIYSRATAELTRLAEVTGIPVADTQAGKGALPGEHPLSVGGVGSTGTAAANALAAEAGGGSGGGARDTAGSTASRSAFDAE